MGHRIGFEESDSVVIPIGERPDREPLANWASDVEGLEALVERLAARDPRSDWLPHALLGSMSGRDWGVFCYKHFDHHLRQFGV